MVGNCPARMTESRSRVGKSRISTAPTQRLHSPFHPTDILTHPLIPNGSVSSVILPCPTWCRQSIPVVQVSAPGHFSPSYCRLSMRTVGMCSPSAPACADGPGRFRRAGCRAEQARGCEALRVSGTERAARWESRTETAVTTEASTTEASLSPTGQKRRKRQPTGYQTELSHYNLGAGKKSKLTGIATTSFARYRTQSGRIGRTNGLYFHYCGAA